VEAEIGNNEDEATKVVEGINRVREEEVRPSDEPIQIETAAKKGARSSKKPIQSVMETEEPIDLGDDEFY
jgi:hypothetical protein